MYIATATDRGVKGFQNLLKHAYMVGVFNPHFLIGIGLRICQNLARISPQVLIHASTRVSKGMGQCNFSGQWDRSSFIVPGQRDNGTS